MHRPIQSGRSFVGVRIENLGESLTLRLLVVTPQEIDQPRTAPTSTPQLLRTRVAQLTRDPPQPVTVERPTARNRDPHQQLRIRAGGVPLLAAHDVAVDVIVT